MANCPTCHSPRPWLHPVVGAIYHGEILDDGELSPCQDPYHKPPPPLDPDAFYALNGNPRWRCKDGRVFRFRDMATSHIRNCIAAIERGQDRDGAKMKNRARALPRLKLELAFRETNNVD